MQSECTTRCHPSAHSALSCGKTHLCGGCIHEHSAQKAVHPTRSAAVYQWTPPVGSPAERLISHSTVEKRTEQKRSHAAVPSLTHQNQLYSRNQDHTTMTSLILALMAGGALAAPAADKITSLPGWPEGTPLPEMYSGYVSLSIHDVKLERSFPHVPHVFVCILSIFLLSRFM